MSHQCQGQAFNIVPECLNVLPMHKYIYKWVSNFFNLWCFRKRGSSVYVKILTKGDLLELEVQVVPIWLQLPVHLSDLSESIEGASIALTLKQSNAIS
jgi:hypothetical protein